MQLTQEAIDEFKAIYKKEYGREISDAEAREKGSRLLRVFMILLEDDGIPENKPTTPPATNGIDNAQADFTPS